MDLAAIRSQFPALQRKEHNQQVIWCDAPGGTQIPQCVIDAMSGFLAAGTTNLHGSFAASQDMDNLVNDARLAAANLIGAENPEEIHFGPNTTSLQFALSHAIVHNWKPGDSIIVTELDHYSNVSPWLRVAQEHDIEIRTWKINDKAELDFNDLKEIIDDSVVFIAVTAASNALGSIIDITPISDIAHAHGALVAVDAVHLAPHKLIDIQKMNCDFLSCSAYKFFGPHIGMQWIRQSIRDSLQVYKVKPSPSSGAARFETGTVNLEGLAGFVACVDYLQNIYPENNSTARARLNASMEAVFQHECELSKIFLNGVQSLKNYVVYGHDIRALRQRTPTFGISHTTLSAPILADKLGKMGIYTWSGHFYACDIPRTLGLNDQGGLLRVGFAHYHTIDEVMRVLEALKTIGNQLT